MKPYNTRVAPSPTGFIHLGNLRTAYHNWLGAKSSGGKFILRIDDTDNDRNKEEYVQKIYDAMNWLGLPFDNTFRQSTTFDRARQIANDLVKADLATVVEGGAIALKAVTNLPDFWTDKIAGRIEITKKDREVLDGMIIVRSDGVPTYNFASILDDFFSGVNLIIRGTDHISNTPKQLSVLWALNSIHPTMDYIQDLEFAHVGLVFEKGKKLSKRDGSSNMETHKNNGMHPDAILNWILRLGWSPSDPNFDAKHKIIPKDMAANIFWNEGSLRNSSSSLDMAKLAFYQKRYSK